MTRHYEEDAQMADENDPEYREEMFQIFRRRGYKPEDLRDPEYAGAYGQWLKTAPPEE